MTKPYKCSSHSLTKDDIFREILKSLEIISSQLGELKTGIHLSHNNNTVFSDTEISTKR